MDFKIKWAAGLFILGYLIYSFDIKSIAAVISRANAVLLAAALLTYACTFVILSMRWMKILEKMGFELSLREAYPAFVAGTLLSDFTPGRLGDLGRAYFVRNRLEPRLGVASVIVDRYMDILALLSLSIVGLILLYGKGVSRHELTYLLLPLSILAFAALTGAFMLWFRREKTLEVILRAAGKLGKKNFSSILKLSEGIGRLKSPRSLLFTGVSLTYISWLTHGLRVSLIINSVGAEVPLYYLPFLLPMISALALIPVSPGGLGLVEGGLVAVLAVIGVPPSSGIAVAIIDRVLTVFFHSAVGLRAVLKNKG